MAITNNGYRVLYRPNHPSAGKLGQILEHRMVMSDAIGRALTRKEVVHHIDGNKLNNDLRNLQLLSGQGAHRTVHAKKPHEKRPCTVCGKPQRCIGLCKAHYALMRYRSGLTVVKHKMVKCEHCGKLVVYRKGITPHCRKCYFLYHNKKPVIPCSICGKPQRCRQLCGKHYSKFRTLAGKRKSRAKPK